MDSPEDPVDVEWRRLSSEWDNDKAHKRFLMLCASFKRLADAGRLYREVRESDPERRERATQQIDRILGLAMQDLELTKSPPSKDVQKWIRWVAFAIGTLLVLGTVLFARQYLLRSY